MIPEKFTSSEFQAAFQEIFSDLVLPIAVAPVQDKKAFLLGGQSGAGKSMLHRVFGAHLSSNVIVVNGDDYRKFHPRFKQLSAQYGSDAVSHTSAWAGAMVEALIDALSENGYNLIIEGTLRTSQVPLRTARLLRERGYSVSLAVMAVKPEISLLSCQIRFERMRIMGTVPRATDPEYHNKIVSEIASNLRVLEESCAFDQIMLFDRLERRLFPSSEEGSSAADVLQQTLFGGWTAEEKAHYEFLERKLNELRAIE